MKRGRKQSEKGGPPQTDRLTPATATGRVKDLYILAKRNTKMKRFAALLGILTLLVASNGAYAQTDYTWNGSTDTKWENSDNWDTFGFPGGGAPARSVDRAIIQADGDWDTVLFDNNSGQADFQNRTVVDILLDSKTNSVALTLQVTGDALFALSSVMLIGDDEVDNTATLEITGGLFAPKVMSLDSSARIGEVEVKLGANGRMQVSEETIVRGGIVVDVAAGGVMETGMLTITNGGINLPAPE